MELGNLDESKCKEFKRRARLIIDSYSSGLVKLEGIIGSIEILKSLDRDLLANLVLATLTFKGKKDDHCERQLFDDLCLHIDFQLLRYFHQQIVSKGKGAELTLTECCKQIGFHKTVNKKRHQEERDEIFKYMPASKKQQKYIESLVEKKGFALLKPVNEYTMYEANKIIEYAKGAVGRKAVATLVA